MLANTKRTKQGRLGTYEPVFRLLAMAPSTPTATDPKTSTLLDYNNADYNNEFVWLSPSVSSWYQFLQQGP